MLYIKRLALKCFTEAKSQKDRKRVIAKTEKKAEITT